MTSAAAAEFLQSAASPEHVCKVEIVDIDESIDYWHQEGARGR
jgi:hypothetical protein